MYKLYYFDKNKANIRDKPKSQNHKEIKGQNKTKVF